MTTLRQQMIELLREEELDALALSQLLSVREKEVYEHLPHHPHIARSLASSGENVLSAPVTA